MRFFDFINLKIYSVWYIPHKPNPDDQVQIPNLDFDFISAERILLLIVFLILFIPLLKEQKDPQFEKQRRSILKLSAIAGALAILMKILKLVFSR